MRIRKYAKPCPNCGKPIKSYGMHKRWCLKAPSIPMFIEPQHNPQHNEKVEVGVSPNDHGSATVIAVHDGSAEPGKWMSLIVVTEAGELINISDLSSIKIIKVNGFDANILSVEK